MFKVGCCGFPVSRKKYYRNFETVEVQQTFYHPPEISTLKKWREEAPNSFEFTMKAWQLITHEPSSPTYKRLKFKIPEEKKKFYGGFKPTDEVLEAWEKTSACALTLCSKVIIFQCPSSFLPEEKNIKNMYSFFYRVKRGDYIFCWEPRGNWEEREIKKICEDLNLIHAVDPFKSKKLSGEIFYFRLHGKKGYRYTYTDEDLMELRKMAEGDGYVMFNNLSMFEDAMRFKGMLENR